MVTSEDLLIGRSGSGLRIRSGVPVAVPLRIPPISYVNLIARARYILCAQIWPTMPTNDFRKLRYFVAVAEELHFRRAAEKLNISQPPLSQHIQRLEDEIGAQLFTRRTNKQVQLTPVGEKLLEGVRLAIQQAERATLEARRSARGELGLLRVGCTRDFRYGYFPDFMADFIQQHNGITVELIEGNSWEQLQRTTNGAVDIAFIARAPMVSPEGLRTRALPAKPLAAVVSASHPLAEQETVSWRQLANDRFVMPIASSPLIEGGFASVFFDYAGFVPEVVAQSSSVDMIASLVARGIGFSIGTSDSYSPNVQDIALITLIDPEVMWSRTAIWNDNHKKMVLDNFLAYLERQIPEQSLPVQAVT